MFIYFWIGLLILKNWKKDSYNLRLIIIEKLTKVICYKLVKTNIDTAIVAQVIINQIMRYYSLLNSIMSNKNILFKSKF